MAKYPSIFEAKEEILEVGRRMYERNFVAANDGNITCKVADDIILATPTGVSKGFMTDEMIVKMTLDGKILYADDKYPPSSEIKMHIRAYRENPEIMAVTHAHPQVATSFSIAGIGLDQPILTEAIMSLGSVPIAKYATPGTEEIPDSIAPFCTKYNAVLLANHGALTWGDSLMQAFYRLESVENYATIMMYTQNIIGRSNPLSCDQIEPLMDIRAKLGVKGGGVPSCAVKATNDKDVLPVSGPQHENLDGMTDAQLKNMVAEITKEVLSKIK